MRWAADEQVLPEILRLGYVVVESFQGFTNPQK